MSIGLRQNVVDHIRNITLADNSKAARKARQVKNASERSYRQNLKRQAEIEAIAAENARQFAIIINDAKQGLQTLLDIGKMKEIRALVAARILVGTGVIPLYSVYSLGGLTEEIDTLLQISLEPEGVLLSIEATRPSLTQTLGAMTRYDKCIARRGFSFKRPDINEEWLNAVFFHDFSQWWDEWDFSREVIPVARPRKVSEFGKATKNTLGYFNRINPIALTELRGDAVDEIQPGMVLVKILTEFKDPVKAGEYVERAMLALR
jgi:hypothetical protein